MSKIQPQNILLIGLVFSLVLNTAAAQSPPGNAPDGVESTYIPVQKQPASNPEGYHPVGNSKQTPLFPVQNNRFDDPNPSLSEPPVATNFQPPSYQPVQPSRTTFTAPSLVTQVPVQREQQSGQTIPAPASGAVIDEQFTPAVFYGEPQTQLPTPATETSVSESELAEQIIQQGVIKEAAESNNLITLPSSSKKTGISLSEMKLKPRSDKGKSSNSKEEKSGLTQMLTTIGSLILVCGLLISCMYAMKKYQPKNQQQLPNGVLDILGAVAVNTQTQLRIIRFGNKMLLVSQSGNHIEAISEITDPAEVDRISGLCHQEKSDRSSSSFKQIFKQYAKESTTTSFVEPASQSEDATDRLRKRLSAAKSVD